MKKILLLLLAAIGAYAVWVKIQQDREERAIWEEIVGGDQALSNPGQSEGAKNPTDPSLPA